jgi:SAM-dependent methyltransferase/ribosomal protein S18 acetylase RimI-like enzyme
VTPVAPEADAGYDVSEVTEAPQVPTTAGYDISEVKPVSSKELQDSDIASYWSEHQADIQADPALRKQFLDAYRKQLQSGFKMPTAAGLKEAAGGVVSSVVGVGKTLVAYDKLPPFSLARLAIKKNWGNPDEPLTPDEKEAQTFVGEAVSGATSAAGNMANLVRTGVRNVANEPRLATANPMLGVAQMGLKKLVGDPKQLTDDELEAHLQEDAAIKSTLLAAAKGEALPSWTGLDPESLTKDGVTLNPANIASWQLLLDPVNLVPMARGFFAVEAAGKTLAVASGKEAAQTLLQKLTRIGDASATVAGRGLTKTSEVAGTVNKFLKEEASVIAGAGPSLTLRAVEEGTKLAGKAATAIGNGRMVNALDTVLASPTMAGSVARTVYPVVEGALHGATASVPFLAGAETPDEASGIVAGGTVFGALGGTAAGLKDVPREAALQAVRARFKQFDAVKQTSEGFGTTPALDVAHDRQIKVVDEKDANQLNHIREVVRKKGIEVYLLPKDVFDKQVGEAEAAAGRTPQPEYNASGYVSGDKIFLNGDTTALGHEVGHAVFQLLAPEARAEFLQTLRDSYTPEQLGQFGETYTQALKGAENPAAASNPDWVLHEVAAEVLSKVINADGLGTVKPTILRTVADLVGRGLEKLGVRTPEIREPGTSPTASALGVEPGFKVAAAASRGIKEIGLEAPTPVIEPEAIAPRRNIRVDPARQAELDKVAKGAGIEDAAIGLMSNPKYGKKEAAIFEQVNRSLSRSQGDVAPLTIDYESVTPTGSSGTDARARKVEQDAAYVQEALGKLPADVRILVDKVAVPYRWQTRGKNVNLLAMSLDKVLANSDVINKRIIGKAAEGEVPYAIRPDGGFTPEASRQFVTDLEVYTRNQANGYAGDGSRVNRPADYQGVIPDENPTFRPVTLPKERADYVNLVMGLAPPKTTKGSKTKPVVPNIEARKLAEANQRPVVPSRTAEPGKDVYTRNGLPIAETNPLRDRLAERGVDVTEAGLFKVTEELNLEHIQKVTGRPESGFRAPSTDMVRAGFMPKPLKEVSEDYIRTRGLSGRAPVTPQLDPEVSKKIADYHDAQPAGKLDAETLKSYRALNEETKAQYQQLVEAGYDIEPWTGGGEPYKSSAEMRADVQNGHLFYLPSEGFLGDNAKVAAEYPPLADSGVRIGGKPVPFNDLFRAVHDIRGHALNGRTFSTHGEFQAWQDHAAEYTKDAQSALALETLGYNAWFNAGKHLRRPDGSIPNKGDKDFVPLNQRGYAPRKTYLFPEGLAAEARKPSASFMPQAKGAQADERTSGLAFKNFFSDVTKGAEKYRPQHPWKSLLPLDGQGRFVREYDKHTGNFDAHIAASIPGFKDVQIRTGDAIVSQYPEGRVLDVGASEGSWTKTISALSQGKIETVALDPNPDMARFFNEKSNVPGATYSTDAFHQGFEDGGQTVKAFATDKPFDVIHESMVFQFISPEREAQLAEAKRLLKPGGVFLTEEKVLMPPEVWKANELLKDKEYKNQYFSDDALKQKQAVVKFQQDPNEAKAVGMVDNMVAADKFEQLLKSQFKHVTQYWDSGNFKGYAASDDAGALKKLVGFIGDTQTKFSTEETPKQIGASFMPSMAEYEAKRAARKAEPARQEERDAIKPEPGTPQLVRRPPLPDSVGDKDLRLLHYSGHGGNLDVLDPKKFGSAAATATDRRGLPKTYYFVEGSGTGADANLTVRPSYGVRAHGGGIYDLTRNDDPLNWLGEVNRETADQKLRDAGYTGLRVKSSGRDVVALFEKTAPTALGISPKPLKKATVPTGAASFSPKAPETPEFKKWFGDSKVVDEGGTPKPVFHGTYSTTNDRISFSPKTGSGRAVEELGYSFKDESIPSTGMFSLRVLDNKERPIGYISANQSSPDSAAIGLVSVDENHQRKGIGEALYRELGTRLKEAGVTELKGTIVGGENVVRLREKVFGPSFDVQRRRGNAIDTVSVIPSDASFAPKVPETPEFKKWFAGSKVVDEQGNPKPMFHGTNADFDRFKKKSNDVGMHFGTAEQANDRLEFLASRRGETGQNVKPVFLRIKNPLRMEDNGTWNADTMKSSLLRMFPSDKDRIGSLYSNFNGIQTPKDIREFLMSKGYDGIVYKNTGEVAGSGPFREKIAAARRAMAAVFGPNKYSFSIDEQKVPEYQAYSKANLDYNDYREANGQDSYIAFAPEQIKSATSNNGNFNPKDPRISFMPKARAKDAGPSLFDDVTETPAQQAAKRIKLLKSKFPEVVPVEYAKDESGQPKLDAAGNLVPVKVPYDFESTPLYKEAAKGLRGDAREEAAAEAFADKIVQLHKQESHRPEIKAAETWYSDVRDRLQPLLGEDTLLFTQLLAATSAQTPVAENFKYTVEAFNKFKAGDYDAQLAKFKEGLDRIAARDPELLAEYAADSKGKVSIDDKDLADTPVHRLRNWWVKKHKLVPMKENGLNFGQNGRQVLNVLGGIWADTVGGPKTPNFAGNLAGTTFEATIDVWATRILHRIGSEASGKPWRLTPDHESGVQDHDFAFGQKAFRKAADRIGIKADSLQALMWFLEKDLWEKNGWSRGGRGAEKSDYKSFLDRTKMTEAGQLQTSKPEVDITPKARVSSAYGKK